MPPDNSLVAKIAIIQGLTKIGIIATICWWVLPHIDTWVSLIARR